jgi:hypothetical protein
MARQKSRNGLFQRSRKNSPEPRDSHLRAPAPEPVSRTQTPPPASEDLVTIIQRANDLKHETLPVSDVLLV